MGFGFPLTVCNCITWAADNIWCQSGKIAELSTHRTIVERMPFESIPAFLPPLGTLDWSGCVCVCVVVFQTLTYAYRRIKSTRTQSHKPKPKAQIFCIHMYVLKIPTRGGREEKTWHKIFAERRKNWNFRKGERKMSATEGEKAIRNANSWCTSCKLNWAIRSNHTQVQKTIFGKGLIREMFTKFCMFCHYRLNESVRKRYRKREQERVKWYGREQTAMETVLILEILACLGAFFPSWFLRFLCTFSLLPAFAAFAVESFALHIADGKRGYFFFVGLLFLSNLSSNDTHLANALKFSAQKSSFQTANAENAKYVERIKRCNTSGSEECGATVDKKECQQPIHPEYRKEICKTAWRRVFFLSLLLYKWHCKVERNNVQSATQLLRRR